MPLDEIRRLLDAPGFNREKALEEHLAALVAKRERMDILIANVRQTIRSLKGEEDMSDTEKFEGFKQRAHAENERRYGSELRRRYGDGIMDAAGARFLDMSEGTYRKAEELDGEVVRLLKEAMEAGEPGGKPPGSPAASTVSGSSSTIRRACIPRELHRSRGDVRDGRAIQGLIRPGEGRPCRLLSPRVGALLPVRPARHHPGGSVPPGDARIWTFWCACCMMRGIVYPKEGETGMLEYKFDTQLLIEGETCPRDDIHDYITAHFKGDCLLAVGGRHPHQNPLSYQRALGRSRLRSVFG